MFWQEYVVSLLSILIMGGGMKSVTREDLPEDKKKEYDLIVEKMMKEIEERNPDQYVRPNQFDGMATKIYIEVSNKYVPQLDKILREAEESKKSTKEE